MADFALDANAVGQVITYVAPGFLARIGYRTRYPGPDSPSGEVLILAVVVSLPLVAFVGAAMPGSQQATHLGYVALLLALGLAIGYVAALIRGTRQGKKLLSKVGYRLDPEGTIYARTLKHMSDEGSVVVELKDGRRVSGTPSGGPQHKGDGVAELYLTYPEAEDHEGEWLKVGEGLIVPLAEISTIALSEEPTGSTSAGTEP